MTAKSSVWRGLEIKDLALLGEADRRHAWFSELLLGLVQVIVIIYTETGKNQGSYLLIQKTKVHSNIE